MSKITKYVTVHDAIEGKKIFCIFEQRPSFGEEKISKRQQVSITGNPATSILMKTWEYKKQ